MQAAAASAAQVGGQCSGGSDHQPGTQSVSCGHSAREGFADGVVDAVKNTVVFKRYYHLFDEGELNGLVAALPGVRLTDSFYDKSNWCAVLEKL